MRSSRSYGLCIDRKGAYPVMVVSWYEPYC